MLPRHGILFFLLPHFSNDSGIFFFFNIFRWISHFVGSRREFFLDLATFLVVSIQFLPQLFPKLCLQIWGYVHQTQQNRLLFFTYPHWKQLSWTGVHENTYRPTKLVVVRFDGNFNGEGHPSSPICSIWNDWIGRVKCKVMFHLIFSLEIVGNFLVFSQVSF